MAETSAKSACGQATSTFEDLQACVACATRLAILFRLGEGECTVSTMSRSLGFSMPALSNHLAVLRRLGLVAFRQVGGSRQYTLSGDAVVLRRPGCVELTMGAGDGSSVNMAIPLSTPAMRRLRPDLKLAW